MFDDYSRSPEDLLKKVVDTRAKMDEYGFRKARLGVAEWHYGPEGWDRVSSADLTGVDSGVYASAVLSRLHDSPVDDMFYYSATLGYWGLVAGRTRRPAWHAFKAFQQLAAQGEAVRVDVPSFPEAGRYALAAKHGGKGHAMLSSFKRGDDWKLTVKGAKPVSVKRLDNALKLETTKAWKWNAGTGALTLVAPVGSTSALWLVEFDL